PARSLAASVGGNPPPSFPSSPTSWRLARSIASRQLSGELHLRVHTLLTHISWRMHVPQSTVRPQPSEIDPQLKPWPAHVVGTQFWGTTVSVSLYDREPSVAVRVTVVVVATGAVVMVTVSTLLPAEMVTLDGTLATWGLSLESAIVGPPDGETALGQSDASGMLPPVTGALA